MIDVLDYSEYELCIQCKQIIVGWEERELKQLDVPDENLVELRSDTPAGIDEKELKSWLVHDTWLL